MSEDGLLPLHVGLYGVTKEAEDRIGDFVVRSVLSYLKGETGCDYKVTGKPDKAMRNQPAPDYELTNLATGKRVGVELVSDFSWDEHLAMVASLPALSKDGFADIAVEHPVASLYRVIARKHQKGQLKNYDPGCRILVVAFARGGACVLGVDVKTGEGSDQLRESITYMNQFPDIDHVFVWWLEGPDGIRLWRIWSGTRLP